MLHIVNSPRAITIPELLFGIALLIILAALLFPAVNGLGPGSEGKSQSKNDVTQIATAITAFRAEYGNLPAWTNPTVSGDLLAALTGSNRTINSRAIVFLEVATAKKNRSGISNGTFIDQWGVPYRIALDVDGDGWVRAGTNNTAVHKVVAVWSDPSLQSPSISESRKNRRYVTAWD